MPQHLQQLGVNPSKPAGKAAAAVKDVSLNANIALILVLVLVIIPTLSGVATII